MTRTKQFLWSPLLSPVFAIVSLIMGLANIGFTLVQPPAAMAYLAVAAVLLAGGAAYLSIKSSRSLARDRHPGRVFFIYAREDLDAARQIARELRQHGFDPWLDVERLEPGQVWHQTAFDALRGSSAALVLVSPNLVKEGFAQSELHFAMNTLRGNRKGVSPLVPVRLADTAVPAGLEHIQWIDAFERGGIDRLAVGLKHAGVRSDA